MSWQEELSKGIRTAEQLAEYMGWDQEKLEACRQIAERYPMMITPYYLSLVNKDDPDDPIARMCIPSADEFVPGGSFDTSGEASNTKLEGLQHKYRRTVLLLSTNQCAMYCRHCFRKRLVGLSNEELNKRVDEVVEYVGSHPEINNVLISGGDSLLNPNHIIERYLRELSAIDHLDFIRFGSRLPVTLPERIYGDGELLDMLDEYSDIKTIYVVTQFNHPRELTSEALLAVRALLDRGVQVRNQTVLLRGVNDSPEVLGELFAGLTRAGITPYYIFQCRPVTGVQNRFQVPLLDGIRIVDGAKGLQNGFGKGVRYAMSHPRGKIEIIGTLPDGQTIFKFHQNKYPEDASRIFTCALTHDSRWLDDELNPI